LYRDQSALGTVPTEDVAYVSIPPPWGEWAASPDPWPNLVPFGGGGSLDVVVPEPATWVAGCCLLGMLGVSVWRERNRQG
jgi:hypothetical protein